MRFISLFSGSSGNCLLISHRQTTLLIDAGLSGKKIQDTLAALDIDPFGINGILVTHEHRDHICGAGILSRRFHLPVYANSGTWGAMSEEIGNIPDENRKVYNSSKPFDIQDLQFLPFATSHDAVEPVGFVINDGKNSMAVATDTGIVTSEMRCALKNRKLIVLESNHDTGMLETGPYPFPLKRRIKSKHGHLSNTDASRLLGDLVHAGTEHIVLAHLSAENNYPLLAYQTAAQHLAEHHIKIGRHVTLEVAKRNQTSHNYIF